MESNTTISWVAIVLSVITLIISLVAINRASQARSAILGETTQAQAIPTPTPRVNEVTPTPSPEEGGFPFRPTQNDQQVGIERAREELQELRQFISSGGAIDNTRAANRIAMLRNDIRLLFLDVGPRARQSWQNIDMSLQEVERRLQAGGPNLLSTIDNALQDLRQDIDYDN